MNQVNPPYLSVKKLAHLLNLLSTRSFKVIDRKTLMETYRYADGDASVATSALKFLNITNDDNSVNDEILTKITAKNEEKRIEAISTMVQDAYHDLFESFPGAATASADDLHDEMKRIYNVSIRVANTAVPAFVYLCEVAGLREKDETKSKQKSGSSNKTTPTKRQIKNTFASSNQAPVSHQNFSDSDSVVINFSNGAIKLMVPQKVMTDSSLIDAYKTLVDAANEFVKQYQESLSQYTKDTDTSDSST